MKIGKIIKYIISIGIAVLLLYYSFKGIGWESFLSGVASCNFGFIFLAMVASIAAFFFRSQRWRILIRPFDSTMDSLTTFNGVNIGYLANFVFPRIGEIVRCGFLSRRSRSRHEQDPDGAVSFDKAIGTVLLSRTWDVLVVLILLSVLLVARWDKFGSFFVNRMWEPLQSRFDISAGWMAAVGVVIVAAAAAVVFAFRRRSRLCSGIIDFAKGILRGFKSFLHMEDKAGFVIYTVLLWAMYWLMSRSILWAMPQMSGMTWVDAWFVTLAGSVAWMVPVPGGFGAYHGMVALALSCVYGLDWDSGLICATLNHESQAITMLLCGTLSYIIEIFRK